MRITAAGPTVVAKTTGLSCTSFVAFGAAADARLGARGAKTAGLLAQVAGVAGAAEGCRLFVRLAPSSAQTHGRGVVFTHWRRREPAQGGRVGICVAIVFAGLFHFLALIGCSFRRKTTDTTKHTGADHMASR